MTSEIEEGLTAEELLANLRKKFEHDPFREIIDGFKFPEEEKLYPHLQDRQFEPIERNLSLIGYEQRVPTEEASAKAAGWRPIHNSMQGKIGRAEVQTGVVNLHVSRDSEENKIVLAQYAHNPHEQEESSMESYNDGIVNVMMEPNGTVHSLMMTKTGDYTTTSFVPDFGENAGLAYPENEGEALAAFKKNAPRAAGFFPLFSKAALLTTAVCDTYRGRERDYVQAEKNMRIVDTAVTAYQITREGISEDLAAVLGVSETKHPLEGLVDKDLIPEHSKVFVVEDYQGLIRNLAEGGYPFPVLFRSHELGMYASRTAVWDKSDATYGLEEFLGSRDLSLGEEGKATILPAVKPNGYTHESQTPLRIIQNNLILQAYEETLGDDQRHRLLDFCRENVVQAKHLVNHSVGLRTEIPDQGDNQSPYSFDKYSTREQEKMLAGFVSGIMTSNRDMLRYWYGKPLWGRDDESTTRWQWAPQGIKELMDLAGFHTDKAPVSKIHAPYVREVKNGIEEKADRPYADPSLSL